jgi:site-specific DNA recombinase
MMEIANQTIGYIRVSGKKQRDDGLSLGVQEKRIEDYCKMFKLNLIDTLCDTVSGKNIKRRPALKKILEMVSARQVSDLVIVKLDRLARNVRQTYEIAELLKTNSCNLHAVTDKIDTSTAMGKAFFGITAVFAEMERELIAERTKMILDGKRENGEVIGTVPYGYKREGDKLVKSLREQRVIERMRCLRGQGLSFAKISKALAGENIQNRKGSLFPPDHIRLIVSRKTA